MRTITLLSQKGGAGKSTLATQLAVLATQRDELVCLIDLDPQGSAKFWRDLRKHARLPLVQAALPERLAGMLEDAGPMGVTVAIVDTAPHTDRGAVEAVRASDLIVCPTKPDLLSLAGLADTIRLLELSGSKGKAVAVINDLPSGAKARENAIEIAMAALKKFDIAVTEQTISHSQAIVDAIGEGKGITEKSPKHGSAKEIGRLWDEIERRLGQDNAREAAQ